MSKNNDLKVLTKLLRNWIEKKTQRRVYFYSVTNKKQKIIQVGNAFQHHTLVIIIQNCKFIENTDMAYEVIGWVS